MPKDGREIIRLSLDIHFHSSAPEWKINEEFNIVKNQFAEPRVERESWNQQKVQTYSNEMKIVAISICTRANKWWLIHPHTTHTHARQLTLIMSTYSKSSSEWKLKFPMFILNQRTSLRRISSCCLSTAYTMNANLIIWILIKSSKRWVNPTLLDMTIYYRVSASLFKQQLFAIQNTSS